MPKHLKLTDPHPKHKTKGAAVLEAIACGSYLDSAAAYAGIGSRTLDRYIANGKAAESKEAEAAQLTAQEGDYLQFWRSYKKARAEAELEALGEIWKAARAGTWQAAAWILERRYPERWGRGPRPAEQAERDTSPEAAAAARRYLERLPDTPLAGLLEDPERPEAA